MLSLSTPKDHTGGTENKGRKERVGFCKALFLEDKLCFQLLKTFTSNLFSTA